MAGRKRRILPAMAPGPLAELPDWALELLAESRIGRLGFVDDDDRPRVLPVTFALAEGVLWSAIDWKRKSGREPARLRYLRRRPRAALTVDRYEEDWGRLAWVQVLCEAHILDGDPGGLEALRSKYAQYRERPPAGPFLRLAPERVLSWRATG
jgi:PPOX class probable F420-dependent enzyme